MQRNIDEVDSGFGEGARCKRERDGAAVALNRLTWPAGEVLVPSCFRAAGLLLAFVSAKVKSIEVERGHFAAAAVPALQRRRCGPALEIVRMKAKQIHLPEKTGSSDAGDLEATFCALAAEWKAGRGHSSSITKMTSHPAYRKIAGMGHRALPLILRELRREPDHWFWALKEITNVNPVPEADRGDMEKMAKQWLAWGRAQGYDC